MTDDGKGGWKVPDVVLVGGGGGGGGIRAIESGIRAIETGPTDAERAADIKARLLAALAPVIDIMNEATRHGLEVNFGVQRDQYGRQTIAMLNVVKPL